MTPAARRLCDVSFAMSRASSSPQPHRVVLWRAPSWQERQHSTASATASEKASQCRPLQLHAKKADINQTASLETQVFWKQLLAGVQKTNAKKLLDQLDLGNPMGVKVLPGRKTGKAPLYPYYLTVKHTHPRKIVLVRVGEFYETMGTDAVLLVQHAGLNPMGQGFPPRAGCPIMNLRKTLNDLVVEAGIPTVVCEEAPDAHAYGQRKSQKRRYVAGVVTPAQPEYMHGLVDGGPDVALDDAAPLLGVSASVGGYQVMEVKLDTHTCTVMEGLTEDAVSARIHQGGMVPPLYIHKSAHDNKASQLSEASFEAEWVHRVAAVSRSQVGLLKRYSSPDPLAGLLELVRLENGLAADTPFQLVKSTALNRPKPLFLSTAQQLGIHRTRGIPSLLDALLSSEASLASRHWLKRLLLLPPPTNVAHAINRACQLLTDLQQPLPWYPSTSSRNIVLRLTSQEASDMFFRELLVMLAAVATTTSSDALRPIAEEILQPVALETGLQQDSAGLHTACRTVMRKIESIIQDSYGNTTPTGMNWADDEVVAAPEGLGVLGVLFGHNESFRGKVQDRLMQAELDKVEAAGQSIEAELSRLYIALTRPQELAKMRPSIMFDKDNNAIWLKIPRNSKASELVEALALEHPRDRNGKGVPDRWSTSELEVALNTYREACLAASQAVRMHLCSLAKDMQADMRALVTASTFAVIVTTLENHVREAARRGWGTATQLSREQCLPENLDSRRTIEIDRMWPYWLDGKSASTVTNSVSMSSMFLLTGPNMAGKSTILRSLCAVALLGTCGLMVPAAQACLPYTDAFILRNFSQDSPLEGRSSFAVEMIEMRYVLDDATEHALVLIDELGKGTEVKAGTAIAGAMLERLHDSHCRGAFATHLHQLLDLPIRVPRLVPMMMETCAADPATGAPASIETVGELDAACQAQLITGSHGRKPTWKMVHGTSRESLALDVALQWRVPASVVRRAASLLLASNQRNDEQQAERIEEDVQEQSAPEAGSSSSDASVGHSIQDAAARLHEASQCLMTSSAEPLEADAGQQLDEASSIATHGPPSSAPAAPTVMAARQNPPPSTVGCSCVYVVRRKDGWFYCGQTDDLRGRLQTHRRSGIVRGGPLMEAAYLVVPSGREGQSLAKAIEHHAIHALQQAGFPLLSVTDSRSKRSPRAQVSRLHDASSPPAAQLSGSS